MVAINKLHYDNLITTNYDDKLFRYNFTDKIWSQISSKLHKYTDVSINSLFASDYAINDYIALHATKTNEILYSEDLDNDVWTLNNISIPEHKSDVTCPPLNGNFFQLTTYNDTTENTDHKVKQHFYTKMNDYVVCSFYVKELECTYTSNFALTAFNNTYGVGLSAIFTLSSFLSTTVSEISVTPSVIDSNYSMTSEVVTKYSNVFGSPSAKIKKYVDESGVYYRVWLMYKANAYCLVDLNMNILNSSSEYLYNSSIASSKYKLYVSGFQTELNKTASTTPITYTYTEASKSRVRTLESIYTVINSNGVKTFDIYNHSLHYFPGAKELTKYNEYTHLYDTVLDNTSLPDSSYYHNDLAVSPSILSFTSTIYDDEGKEESTKSEYVAMRLGDYLIDSTDENFTRVGTPIIIDKVMTNSTPSRYITTNTIIPTSFNTFDLTCKYKAIELVSYSSALFAIMDSTSYDNNSYTDSKYPFALLKDGGNFSIMIGTTPYWVNTESTTFIPKVGVDYLINVKWDNVTKKMILKLSEDDGETWAIKINQQVDSMFPAENAYVKIRGRSEYSDNFYLSRYSLKINGEEVWKPYPNDLMEVLYYDATNGLYKFKQTDESKTILYSTNEKSYKNIVKAMTFNQGYFETWSRQGKVLHKYGYNTGGGCNFYKINLLGHKTRIPA